MDKILKKAAEILVECGFAVKFNIDKREHLQHSPPICLIVACEDRDFDSVTCDPFADTLEGRRQADTIEDWLRSFNALDCSVSDLWDASKLEVKPIRATGISAAFNQHQWRLDRIKFCLEQLGE
jgi:hypothetical protein